MKLELPEFVDADELMQGVMQDTAVLGAVVALETIEFAQSYTGEVITKDKSYRLRHASYKGPPGWGDKKFVLVTRYNYDVTARGEEDISVRIGNSAPHASLVEAKGYWVVKGLFDKFLDDFAREMAK